MRKIVTALMCLIPVATLGANNDSDHKWFITAAESIHSITDIKISIPTRNISEFHRDGFAGYSIGLGRDWEWIAAGVYLGGFSVDSGRAQTLSGRVMMQVFPMDNLPYLLMEYGTVRINNGDLHLHKSVGMYGIGTGVRFDLTNALFCNLEFIYNRSNFDFSVSDVPGSVRARRWNIILGVGYWF